MKKRFNVEIPKKVALFEAEDITELLIKKTSIQIDKPFKESDIIEMFVVKL